MAPTSTLKDLILNNFYLCQKIPGINYMCTHDGSGRRDCVSIASGDWRKADTGIGAKITKQITISASYTLQNVELGYYDGTNYTAYFLTPLPTARSVQAGDILQVEWQFTITVNISVSGVFTTVDYQVIDIRLVYDITDNNLYGATTDLTCPNYIEYIGERGGSVYIIACTTNITRDKTNRTISHPDTQFVPNASPTDSYNLTRAYIQYGGPSPSCPSPIPYQVPADYSPTTTIISLSRQPITVTRDYYIRMSGSFDVP